MSYPIKYSRSRRNREQLTPEEEEVRDALSQAGYEMQDEHTDTDPWTLFTPIQVLYDEYLAYTLTVQRDWGVENLSVQQFGVALRRVFGVGLWPEYDRKDWTRRRTVNKKRVFGVSHLKGPETIRLPFEMGRRPKHHDYFID